MHDVPVRTRGAGHALNGASLPGAHELALRTERLCSIRFEQEGTVTVGGGIVLWTLRSILEGWHYALPVVNDGYSGPTVGGFACAGGFGHGSNSHGGFWENVAELTVVDGRGELQRVTREDPLFPWLFGAMGQLGIIVEARLDIRQLHPLFDVRYPGGLHASARAVLEAQAKLDASPPANERGRRLYWFTLFLPEARREEALQHLSELESRHVGTFDYRERYAYPIRYRRIAPPLLYPEAESFLALGTWGFHERITPDTLRQLEGFDEDFMALAAEHGYRRYIQSELPSGPATYERYFGPGRYAELRELKRRQDPRSILNRGWVFPP